MLFFFLMLGPIRNRADRSFLSNVCSIYRNCQCAPRCRSHGFTISALRAARCQHTASVCMLACSTHPLCEGVKSSGTCDSTPLRKRRRSSVHKVVKETQFLLRRNALCISFLATKLEVCWSVKIATGCFVPSSPWCSAFSTDIISEWRLPITHVAMSVKVFLLRYCNGLQAHVTVAPNEVPL